MLFVIIQHIFPVVRLTWQSELLHKIIEQSSTQRIWHSFVINQISVNLLRWVCVHISVYTCKRLYVLVWIFAEIDECRNGISRLSVFCQRCEISISVWERVTVNLNIPLIRRAGKAHMLSSWKCLIPPTAFWNSFLLVAQEPNWYGSTLDQYSLILVWSSTVMQTDTHMPAAGSVVFKGTKVDPSHAYLMNIKIKPFNIALGMQYFSIFQTKLDLIYVGDNADYIKPFYINESTQWDKQ